MVDITVNVVSHEILEYVSPLPLPIFHTGYPNQLVHLVDDFASPIPLAMIPFGDKSTLDDSYSKREFMPWWLSNNSTADNSIYLKTDRSGTISGSVRILGVPVNKSMVNLYYRKTGALIQSTFTNANGAFSFACGLDRSVSNYYAIAITEEPYNAKIYDKLTPV